MYRDSFRNRQRPRHRQTLRYKFRAVLAASTASSICLTTKRNSAASQYKRSRHSRKAARIAAEKEAVLSSYPI